jgi:hypothetical protein
MHNQPMMRILVEFVRYDLHWFCPDFSYIPVGRQSYAVADAEDVSVTPPAKYSLQKSSKLIWIKGGS